MPEPQKQSAKNMAELVQRQEMLNILKGSGEKNNEPDYELLKRHFEVWVRRHPKEMAEHVQFIQATKEANYKKTGASDSNHLRNTLSIPKGLFDIFLTLSPNFIGANELTPQNQVKRMREFAKHFPVFQTCEKL